MDRCPSCAAEIAAQARFCASCGSALAATTPISLGPAPTPLVGAAPVPAAARETRFLPGALLNQRYRIVALLGRGGMGEVYRADDLKLGQPVALKFLPESLARDAASLERFFAEVRIGRTVSHPNVCRLYDLVETDGQHALSMELVDGEDLATLLKRIGRLPADKGIEIARDLCAGLAAAHDKGVIHRDLKPANVMIDGRGRARITDFGIAALAEDAERAGFAGTPAYMAPEQLLGRPASARSDLYALGLVLYEAFCGKRPYEAASIDELKALHAASEPPSLGSGARDVPPEVERVVRRCMDRDPLQRPESAHLVLAALPGGDPLQAALAAGETPTPAMVAAAGKVGELRTAWAALLFALGVAGLFAAAHFAREATLIGRVHPDVAPEVLTAKARALLEALGHVEPPADHATVFDFAERYSGSISLRDPSGARFAGLESTRPGPLEFVYRQSPQKLRARVGSIMPFQPSEIGRITRTDPPMTLPGMAEVVLDQRGALVSLRVKPPELDPGAPGAAPDWTPVLAATGLDPATLRPGTPRWTAPFDSDRKAAWDGAYPEQPDVPIHLEAASYRGRITWAAVFDRWSTPAEEIRLSRGTTIGLLVVLAASLAANAALVMLVRRNLRLGRGDRKGAARLAFAIGGATAVAVLIRPDHVAMLFDEASLIVLLLPQIVFFAAAGWIFYIALEPLARRRRPELLISWARLLDGRAGDPMVGRDVLIGAVTGIAMYLVVLIGTLLPEWLGWPASTPHAAVISTLSNARHVVYFAFTSPIVGMVLALGSLFELFLWQALFRSRVVALAVLFAVSYLAMLFFTHIEDPLSATTAVFCAIWLVALLRCGLLAGVVAFATFHFIDALPLTLDAGTWYAPRGYFGLTLLAALLAVAAWRSLGAQPVAGRALLD